MKAKTVAIVGVDGSGKSTLAISVAERLSKFGVNTGVLHLSKFVGILGWEKFSNNFTTCWKYAGKNNHWMLVLLSICSALIYPFAKRKMEKGGIQCILVEHHPRIDFPVFARIYKGTFGELMTRLVIWLWEKPDLVVHITLSCKQAEQNICSRRDSKQYHERHLDQIVKLTTKELGDYRDKIVSYNFPVNAHSCAKYILTYFWEEDKKSTPLITLPRLWFRQFYFYT